MALEAGKRVGFAGIAVGIAGAAPVGGGYSHAFRHLPIDAASSVEIPPIALG